MAASAKSTKRFGSRYGVTIRNKFGKIEAAQHSMYDCPACRAKRVKRLVAGIWQCKKCGHKVAGKCYSLSKDVSIKEAVATGDDIFGSKKKGKVVSEEDAS